MRRNSTATDSLARRNRRAALSRWYARGSAIPHDTEDLRLAIKREVWSRGLTLEWLNRSLGFAPLYVNNLLSNDASPGRSLRRITPGVLKRIIAVLHITPAVARRLQLLGAREDGWQV